MTKRTLVFDASILVTASLSGDVYKTGLYRVCYELLKGLIKTDTFVIYLYDVFGRERELRACTTTEFERVKILQVDSKWYKFLAYPVFNLSDKLRNKQIGSKRKALRIFYSFFKNSFYTLGRCFTYIEKKKNLTPSFPFLTPADIYLSTYYPIPSELPFLKSLRKAIIIHDLIPILHPEYFYNLDNKRILENVIGSISYNDLVICVSDSTKRDFLHIKPSFSSKQVFVSHLAGSTCFHPIHSPEKEILVRDKYKIPLRKSYFLSVCTLEPRKNIQKLVYVYEHLLTKNKLGKEIPVLVLTGAYGWKSEPLLDQIKQINSNYPESIILTGFVSDEELAVLYSNSNAFIYPSLYEGFGLPPLEAMQCGAPVITSNNSSLPEVIGDVGIMIDTNNDEEFLLALLSCIDDRNSLVMREKSLKRAALFSWDKTVNTIIDILNN